MITIRHRGTVVHLAEDVSHAYDWLLANQPDSVAHAITRGGYSARNEAGEVVTFYTKEVGRTGRAGKFKKARP